MLEISNFQKQYDNLLIIKNLSFTVPAGKVTVLLGPSGCGKTTILNAISGLDKDYSGKINGKFEKISYVFQEDRLLPWMTLDDNINFVLKEKNIAERERILKILKLQDYRDFYPNELSGGLKQRVSIARAFIYPSDLILMDEPFRSLDFKLKINIIKDLLNLEKESKKTIFLVTHDTKVAYLLADKAIVLSEKPAEILSTITFLSPKEERLLYSDDFHRFEDKVFEELL